jgi:hypothetical protein
MAGACIVRLSSTPRPNEEGRALVAQNCPLSDKSRPSGEWGRRRLGRHYRTILSFAGDDTRRVPAARRRMRAIGYDGRDAVQSHGPAGIGPYVAKAGGCRCIQRRRSSKASDHDDSRHLTWSPALFRRAYFPVFARRSPLGVRQSGPWGHCRRSIRYRPISRDFISGRIWGWDGVPSTVARAVNSALVRTGCFAIRVHSRARIELSVLNGTRSNMGTH